MSPPSASYGGRGSARRRCSSFPPRKREAPGRWPTSAPKVPARDGRARAIRIACRISPPFGVLSPAAFSKLMHFFKPGWTCARRPGGASSTLRQDLLPFAPSGDLDDLVGAHVLTTSAPARENPLVPVYEHLIAAVAMNESEDSRYQPHLLAAYRAPEHSVWKIHDSKNLSTRR